MGQIEDLRLFTTVVDTGGIAKAAKQLNIAKSAVSRRLGQMEDRYGVILIDRQPRAWEITTAGQELYQRATGMVADADDLDADFLHTAHSLKGPLKISVAREFGIAFLQPVLFEFAAKYPEIDMTVDFDDRMVDLDRENYDLAIRITTNELEGLINHPLGKTRHGLFASKSYCERHNMPNSLKELTEHPLLHYGTKRRARWDFSIQGKKESIEFQPALNSNNGPFLIHAALNDFGIIRLPDFVVADFIQNDQLIPVLPQYEISAFGIYLVYSDHRRVNKRMRLIIDTLKQFCAEVS